MENLISMKNYVMEQSLIIEKAEQTHFEAYENILKYAKFLSMPLELKMFVPVDEYGSVMKEPTVDAYMQPKEVDRQFEAYEKALSEVIFEGFEICNKINQEGVINENMWVIIQNQNFGQSTLEDLVKFNLTLTLTEQAREKYKF